MTSIKNALKKLDHADDSKWTADGRPTVRAIEELTGQDHTREELDAELGDFRRQAAAADEPQADDEHITQHKPSMAEALAGEGKTMEDIGKGSIVEEAPAVRAQEAVEEGAGRVVQQGDDVILHSSNPIAGALDVRGKILKVNQDGTVAVRVPLPDGRTEDFSGVYNARQQDGSKWFEFAPTE